MEDKEIVKELIKQGKTIPFRLLESEKLLEVYIKNMMK